MSIIIRPAEGYAEVLAPTVANIKVGDYVEVEYQPSGVRGAPTIPEPQVFSGFAWHEPGFHNDGQINVGPAIIRWNEGDEGDRSRFRILRAWRKQRSIEDLEPGIYLNNKAREGSVCRVLFKHGDGSWESADGIESYALAAHSHRKGELFRLTRSKTSTIDQEEAP